MKILFATVCFATAAFAAEVHTGGIVKKDLGLAPAALVKEYVERDANGEFLKTNKWWNSAVACPECMGGPETFTIISSYEIKKIDDLNYDVTYQIEGEVDADTFAPSRKVETRPFTVVKTDWGFKLDRKAYQMVFANVVSKRMKTKIKEESLNRLRKITVKN